MPGRWTWYFTYLVQDYFSKSYFSYREKRYYEMGKPGHPAMPGPSTGHQQPGCGLTSPQAKRLNVPPTFQQLSTGLSPCWGWKCFLLFSLPSPPWLLVVWWIRGHPCFNWLDFQLLNSQIVFAALLTLDSPYDICYKKTPVLSASEIATQPEKLKPNRCDTQKVLQN